MLVVVRGTAYQGVAVPVQPKRSEAPWRPSPEQLAAAAGRRVPDVVAPDLDILYCGINPSLYSAAVGHNFARPGNRFWPVLAAAGLTPVRLGPFEERRLLDYGQGITNLVARATARAEEISAEELLLGGRRLRSKVARLRPRTVAFLGVTSYRTAFGLPRATVGLQGERLGKSRIWVLPNPSGLNAHYQLPDLARLFAQLRGSPRA
jgi:double-stranded uracil-DNA glycosylase